MTLLPGEEILLQIKKNTLTVTSKRVRYDNRSLGSGDFMSIMLSEVASAGIVTRFKVWLLPIGALSLLGALQSFFDLRYRDFAIPLLIVGALCTVAYLLTRSHVLRITSAGDAIVIESRGMKREQILTVVDTLEDAKDRLPQQELCSCAACAG